MGYCFTSEGVNTVLKELAQEFLVYAPVCIAGGGAFSDTNSVRYQQIESVEEIELEKKSNFSFKELLLPISQTLFFFTEDSIKEADAPKKGAIIFLRSCDLHAVKRLDEIYLRNGGEDYYYKRLRERVKFILIGCKNAYENCFCVDMNTNRSEDYDAAIDCDGDHYFLDCKYDEWDLICRKFAEGEMEVTPSFVTETKVHVTIPENLTAKVALSDIWMEYDSRCINCGRCNFVCPTCTCFTMQDLYYTDNGKAGERRRVWASCMVDGFTDVAGGGAYRKKNGERMRFKVLHKVLDFAQRSGCHMCVGCGRCDDACPEYISFSNCINKLKDAVVEVE